MLQRELIKYFNNDLTVDSFITKIKDEIAAFRLSLSKKGSSIPILYSEEEHNIVVKSNHIRKMLSDYIDGKLDGYTVSYISDALLLSDNTSFETEKLIEVLEELSEMDSSPFSKIEVVDFLKKDW